ncbi:MAG: polysaccharide deacetylase family protein, partial [Polyangiaceae bacterium]
MGLTRSLLRGGIVASLVVACTSPAREIDGSTPSVASPTAIAKPDLRAQIDGRSFPAGVLALTFDDGPDAGTLVLAEYLSERRIAATFFVVNAWVEGLSSDPGEGGGVY